MTSPSHDSSVISTTDGASLEIVTLENDFVALAVHGQSGCIVGLRNKLTGREQPLVVRSRGFG